MRVCALLSAYLIILFHAICFPDANVYLVAWLDLFQSIALYSFFLLLCNFLNPIEEERGAFLAKLRPKKDGESPKTMESLVWFRLV
jgi:hypothetical protein